MFRIRHPFWRINSIIFYYLQTIRLQSDKLINSIHKKVYAPLLLPRNHINEILKTLLIYNFDFIINKCKQTIKQRETNRNKWNTKHISSILISETEFVSLPYVTWNMKWSRNKSKNIQNHYHHHNQQQQTNREKKYVFKWKTLAKWFQSTRPYIHFYFLWSNKTRNKMKERWNTTTTTNQ